MDEQEVVEILSELKQLKSEIERGTVTVIPVTQVDEPDSTANKWTLQKALCDIRLTIASSLRIKTNGTQLLARILSEAKRVCDQTVSFTNYVDLPVEKEKGLALEMNKCIDDACSVLEETKKLRRELEALKLRHSTSITNTDSTSRRNLEEKKISRFIVKTLDEAKELHDVIFRCGFEETDEIKDNLETKCDGNKQLYSLFLSENIVKRCRGELEGVQSLLIEACQMYASECTKQSSLRNMSRSVSEYLSKVALRCKREEDENVEIQQKHDQLEKENANLRLRCKSEEDKYIELKQKYGQLEEEKANLEMRCKSEEDKYIELKQKHEQLEEEKANLEMRLADKEHDLINKEKRISLLQEGQRTLLNRLSQYTSAQLTHENPNVADLSDPKRPTKIGEQFSELYDNQWTDAFSTLTDNYRFSEERSISSLMILLDQAYAFSIVSCATQDRTIKLALQGKSSNYIMSHEETAQSESDLAALDWKMIFDLKKRTSDSSAKAVGENFLNHVKKLALVDVDAAGIKEYVIKCAEVCWHMVLQSPQLYMESCFEDEETFNTNKYKHYKTKGNKYKFIVWPVLYLHKDGPMLSKGIAEAKAST